MLARNRCKSMKILKSCLNATIRTVRKLMIVAGEPSGDAHAAALVNALRATNSDLSFFGATGPLMRAAGVETTVNSDDLAIMGIVEVGRVFPRFIKAFRKLRDAAIQKSPDAVILVDWPEFNLRLASALHRRGLKVIYYISPQLWAWRPGRVSKIKENVDLLLSILPFEVDWYKAHGVDHVEFVGHPLSGEVKARFGREEFCRRNDLDPARPIISFLPGSRQKEVERILPPMLDAIEELRTVRPEVQAVVVIAPSRTAQETYELMSRAINRASPSWSNNKLARRSRLQKPRQLPVVLQRSKPHCSKRRWLLFTKSRP